MLTRLRAYFEDLSLPKTLATALILGLAVPVGISLWLNVKEQSSLMLKRLDVDLDRVVNVIALGMQMPLWEIRPDAGKPLLEAVMVDERVTLIRVSSPLLPNFLEVKAPRREARRRVSRESPVLHGGEVIGHVRVDMDTGQLESQLASQWRQILLICLLQLAAGMCAVILLLRYKIMAPLRRLIRQSETLAGGAMDQPLAWQRGDELGVLGRSFEKMRQSLRELFCRLEQRNRELQDREAELTSQAAVMRAILEAHPVPVVISALEEDRLLYVSPGMGSLFGTSVADIMAHLPQDLFVDRADRFKLKTILLDKGSVDSHECALRKTDGSIFPAAITAKRVSYLGVNAAVVGVFDLTAIKSAEQEIARQQEALHQSEKLSALGSLLAGVAHELNNPLSVVVGRTIMLEGEATEPTLKTRLGKIRLAAERCARIVKTFLAVARQQPPVRAPVQLNAVLEASVELMGYGLRTADIVTTLDLDPDLPELSADADQLTQVFTNLIINAQQALLEVPGPRRLIITTRYQASARTARLEFCDNGPGVPEVIRSRIFEPFYTSKPVGKGTGIGLSFSHGVITAHGGKISLESPTAGGARFVITLPLTPTRSPRTPSATATDGDIAPRAVLIVDDEPDIAHMLSEMLVSEGHRIDIASSGNEALRRLAERSYDVILSDLKMPDLDGAGLYRRLQEEHSPLLDRLIFISGDTLGVGASEFLARSGRPLLEKPFIPTEVVHVVRQVLRQSSLAPHAL